MTTEQLIARVQDHRRCLGLLVSADRNSSELTEQFGRFIYCAADVEARDAFIARETLKGRNPRIER